MTASRSAPLRALRSLFATVALGAGVMVALSAVPAAQSDLDTFMQQVLERRDANWKKLQQYILDEREQIEMRGPAGTLLWGERRDYAWYVRDGFFVRSPVKVNGAAVGEADRLKYRERVSGTRTGPRRARPCRWFDRHSRSCSRRCRRRNAP